MSGDPKNLINKMLKQADMAALPGSVNVKNRTLDFHIFDRNKLKQKLSKLPDVVKESIQRQIAEFDRAFKQYQGAQSRDYAGMLRIAYAEDRLIGEKELNDLSREQPNLVETAKFVREYGIQLPSSEAGFSLGKKVDKGIGSKFWFSIFGYAYQDLAEQGFPYHVAQKRNKIPRSIQENVSGKERPNSTNGTFQVVQSGEGFTFGIVNEAGTTNIFDSTVTSNTIIMRKFFNEPIIVNRSAVYVSPVEGLVPDEMAAQTEFDPHSTFIRYVNNADLMISNNGEQAKFIFGIFADPDTGALYLQRKSRYGAGGRPVIDRETGKKVERTTGEKIMLNYEQVYSLANRGTIGKAYRVTAQTEGEILDQSEVASGYKFAYSVEDEVTLRKIMEPQNMDEFKYSVPALKQLKQWVDARASRYSFDEKGNATPQYGGGHTALEGFIIYMAGPDFSMGRNIDQGETIGKAQMMQYKDLPAGVVPEENPQVGDFLPAKRESFVVVAKQISIPRMMASERFYENKLGQRKITLSPWREVRTGLPSLSAAVAEMRKIIAGDGGKIVEDDEGNINKPILPRLNPESRGVQRADEAFREFTGQQPPQQLPKPKPPVRDEDPEKNPDLQASTIATRLIRSFKNNV